jgi:hypothetical protein
MMDAFDQRIAAVADIPFTRLMGRSPAGMNATGQHDTDNWKKAVASGQRLELRPCLDRLDQYLIPSAGVDPAGVTWRFAPLGTPSEAEEAATFKTTMEAVEKLIGTATIPDVAMSKAVQNLMSEREWLPGLDQALAELPEDVRFGLQGEPDDTDPSALQEGGGLVSRRAPGDPMEAEPRRRAANDKRGVADDSERPFDDAARTTKKQRLGRGAATGSFDPNQPRDRSGKWIPSGTRALLADAKAGRTGGKPVPIGNAAPRAASMVSRHGIDLRGKSVVLDPSLTRHTILRHGRETRPGQNSVQAADLSSAASILGGLRPMRRVAPAGNGAARFIAVTRSKGQLVYTIFESRRKTVAVVTMWIRE